MLKAADVESFIKGPWLDILLFLYTYVFMLVGTEYISLMKSQWILAIALKTSSDYWITHSLIVREHTSKAVMTWQFKRVWKKMRLNFVSIRFETEVSFGKRMLIVCVSITHSVTCPKCATTCAKENGQCQKAKKKRKRTIYVYTKKKNNKDKMRQKKRC